jgi:transposase
MPYGAGSNTVMKVGGFLNAVTGKVHHWEAPKVTAAQLAGWWTQVAKAYPRARVIYLVLDNLPTHLHPRAVAAFANDPRLKPLYLPTYAPWLNPIEKLWRLAKQTVAHAHHYCDDFHQLRRTVNAFLKQPTSDPNALLKYVGLTIQ